MIKKLLPILVIAFSLNSFAVTKVKPLYIGVDGVPSEANSASDYTTSKGFAFENSDSTLIDVGSSRVQVTHNGVTAPVCQQADTTLTTGSVPFADSSGRLAQQNSKFFYSSSNEALAIGQTDTSVNVNSSSLVSKFTTDVESDLIGHHVHMHNGTAAVAPNIVLSRSRGSHASPTIVSAGDRLGILAGHGYTGNGTVGYQKSSQIYFEVDPNASSVSTTSMPGKISFLTTPEGSVTPATALTLDKDKTATFSGNVQMSGNTVHGNTSTSGNLVLSAHPGSFTVGDTGRIQLKERLTFNESFSVSSSLDDAFFVYNPTITSSASASFPTLKSTPIYNYSVQQILSASPAFYAGPVYRPTVSGIATDIGFWSGFVSEPYFSPNITSGTAETYVLWGYVAGVNTSRANAGTVTVKDATNFSSFGNTFISTDIGANTNVDDLSGFRAQQPTIAGTVQRHYGLKIDAISGGSSATYGIHNSMTANASRWFIYDAGGAVSNLTGALRIGDTTQASQKLEVMGNLLIDNTDNTAREARFKEPSSSGSNYTAFKAQAQSGDVTYILPAADGSSGQVLQTNGSGTLSWVTSSATQSVWLASKTGGTSRTSATGTTLSADPDLDITVTWANSAKYALEGAIFFTNNNATPDIDWQWNGPAITAGTLRITYEIFRVANTTIQLIGNETAFVNGGTAGDTLDMAASVEYVMKFSGAFQTSGTPGSNHLEFQWGQNVSNANNTTVQAGSWMKVSRVQ